MTSIGGKFDMKAMAALSGSQDVDDARMRHFHCLDRAQQTEAIRGLHAAGYSVRAIAAATRLSLEAVSSVLEDPIAKPSGEAVSAHPPTVCPRTGVPMRFCTCIGPHA